MLRRKGFRFRLVDITILALLMSACLNFHHIHLGDGVITFRQEHPGTQESSNSVNQELELEIIADRVRDVYYKLRPNDARTITHDTII